MLKEELTNAIPPDIKSYFNKTNSEAKLKGVAFDLTLSDIARLLADTARCPVMDIPLFNSKGQGGSKNTPNLVRLVAHKGYVCGNVVVLSQTARTMRQDASPDQLRRLADLIEEAECPAKRSRSTAAAT